jgi:hypothetical protein
MSEVPPGGYGIMMRIGLFGNDAEGLAAGV